MLGREDCSHRVAFFCKQKTAYEMKECDWSSDVCSSDLCSRVAAFVCWRRCGVVCALYTKEVRRWLLPPHAPLLTFPLPRPKACCSPFHWRPARSSGVA